MAYTTEALVTAEIGTGYESTTDLTSAHVAAFIADADEQINLSARGLYWPFNAVGSSATDGTTTYTTPKVIGTASMRLTLAMCLEQLRGAGRAVVGDRVGFLYEQVGVTLEQLRDPSYQLGYEEYLDDSLTFGTAAQSWMLDTTEAFLASTTPLDSGDPPHIYRDSVKLSANSTGFDDVSFTAAQLADMRCGEEYLVEFDPGHHRWVFKARYADLNKVDDLKVSYKWDYRRQFANEVHLSGVLST